MGSLERGAGAGGGEGSGFRAAAGASLPYGEKRRTLTRSRFESRELGGPVAVGRTVGKVAADERLDRLTGLVGGAASHLVDLRNRIAREPGHRHPEPVLAFVPAREEDAASLFDVDPAVGPEHQQLGRKLRQSLAHPRTGPADRELGPERSRLPERRSLRGGGEVMSGRLHDELERAANSGAAKNVVVPR